jgi:putative ABC transport system permease protein
MHALYQEEGKQVVYVGVDDNMLSLKPHWKIEGEFPSRAGEVLVGAEVAERRHWQLGQTVQLPGLSNSLARVAGVLKAGQGADDSFIYMRLADAQKAFKHPAELTHILVRLKDPNEMDRAVSLLRGCDAGMDMNVVPLAHLFRTIQKLVGSTRLLLASVAMVALLLAVSGVVNAVLMAVTERTQEIGMMRALGASRSNIFWLIWLETWQVCAAGGIVGVVTAYIFSNAVETWLRGRLPFAPTEGLIKWDWSIAGICVFGALVVGSVAGLMPAWRAIRPSPVEAMRLGQRT